MPQDQNQSNDTIDITFNATLPPTIPYTQDFEQLNSGWITSQFGSLSTKWELGSPTYGTTNSVHAGSNCWDINLTTPYGNYANTKLLSPPFSYSLLNPSELRCWVNYNTEFGADGVQLQYSFDGFTFLPLGIFNDPKGTNWFDAANVTSFNGPAWCGNSNGWREVVYNTSSFYGYGYVQYAFVFKSDPLLTADGFSVDDFSINGTVGVEENQTPFGIHLYPNPVTDILTIRFDKTIPSKADVSVHTLEGAVVLHEVKLITNNSIQINLKNISQGIYITEIKIDNTTYHARIVKTD